MSARQSVMARQTLKTTPADAVGLQVPVGRIVADRMRWQTVFDARDKPMVYRLCNTSTTSLVVEVDNASRTHQVEPGASIDVLGKRIRVKAGGGGTIQRVGGWYALVS